ncbi:MAG: acylphosphatase [Thermodesulfobacteriota bacterium]|nr:acylphosphatase [Thermodesulfobacteriota bacterium]
MKKVRAHVCIDGRVQGVCFRMDTRRAAIERNVTGWVRNLPDGRVEAVFEGDDADVRSAVRWCETGPPIAHVTTVDVEWESYTGEFDSFQITFG